MPNTFVMLSAGHHLNDPGAVVAGYEEHTLLTQLVSYVFLQHAYESAPYVLIGVPPLPLSEKITMVNMSTEHAETNPTGTRVLAIELHLNSARDTHARGTEVFYFPSPTGRGARLGRKFLAGMEAVSGLPARTAKPDTKSGPGRLAWVRDTRPYALLVEVGFMTNATDRALLTSEKTMARIARGVISGTRNAVTELESWSTARYATVDS